MPGTGPSDDMQAAPNPDRLPVMVSDAVLHLATAPWSPLGIQAALVVAFDREQEPGRELPPDSDAAQLERSRVQVRPGGYTVELAARNRDLAFRIAGVIVEAFRVKSAGYVQVDVGPDAVNVTH